MVGSSLAAFVVLWLYVLPSSQPAPVCTGDLGYQIPCGSAGPIGLGQANNLTALPGGIPTGGCPAPMPGPANDCFSVPVASVSEQWSAAHISFELVDAKGTALPIRSPDSVTLEAQNGSGLAIWTPAGGWGSCSTRTCTSLPSYAVRLPVALTAGPKFVVFSGQPSLSGESLRVLGLGPLDRETTSTPFP